MNNLTITNSLKHRKEWNIFKKIFKLCRQCKKWKFDFRRINSKGYIKGSWKLVDSEKRAEENKYTFYKPSREITKNLKVGSLVKLTFEFDSTNKKHPSAERMWVKIIEINEDKFKGHLDNQPYFINELIKGTEINFEHKHIINHNLEITEPNLVEKYINRCLVTNKVLFENAPVNFIYREEPMEKPKNWDWDWEDSGWRIMSGDESDEYMHNDKNTIAVSLGAVLSLDDSFIDLLESEIGTSFVRNDKGVFVKKDE